MFRDVLVTSIEADISYEGLLAEMKDICKFEEGQPFTIKWVDEEGNYSALITMDLIN